MSDKIEQPPITRDEFNTLSKSINTVQKTLDRFYSDWADDSKDVSKVNERVGKLEATTQHVADAFRNQTKNLKSALEDTLAVEMQPINEVNTNMKKLVKNPPAVVFYELKKIKFFTKLLGRFKGKKVEKEMQKEVEAKDDVTPKTINDTKNVNKPKDKKSRFSIFKRKKGVK